MFLLRIRKDFDLVQRYWGPKGRGTRFILCLTSLFVSLEIEIFSESVAKNVTWCFILTEMHYFVHYFCQKLYWFATIALLLLCACCLSFSWCLLTILVHFDKMRGQQILTIIMSCLCICWGWLVPLPPLCNVISVNFISVGRIWDFCVVILQRPLYFRIISWLSPWYRLNRLAF